jgi:hypothetical protein
VTKKEAQHRLPGGTEEGCTDRVRLPRH